MHASLDFAQDKRNGVGLNRPARSPARARVQGRNCAVAAVDSSFRRRTKRRGGARNRREHDQGRDFRAGASIDRGRHPRWHGGRLDRLGRRGAARGGRCGHRLGRHARQAGDARRHARGRAVAMDFDALCRARSFSRRAADRARYPRHQRGRGQHHRGRRICGAGHAQHGQGLCRCRARGRPARMALGLARHGRARRDACADHRLWRDRLGDRRPAQGVRRRGDRRRPQRAARPGHYRCR